MINLNLKNKVHVYMYFSNIKIQILPQHPVIRLEIMPMSHPAPWVVKQWAIAAGNAPKWKFQWAKNEKLKEKQEFIYFKHVHLF